MTMPDTGAPKHLKIKPDQVTVDLRAQRALDLKRVKKLVDAFRLDSFGTPSVSRRDDGTFHCIDGQHRFAAARERGFGNTGFTCQVYDGLTLAQEAAMFRLLNASKNLSPADLFRIAVTEGDEVAVAANNGLQVFGWTAEQSKRNTYSALNTLAYCWEIDSDGTRAALRIAATAWGPTRHSSSMIVMRGLFAIVNRYRNIRGVDWDRMSRLLAQKGSASEFVARAKGNAAGRGISQIDGFADLVVNEYNYRLAESKRLPIWDTANRAH
jgi:hypothetical protein